MLLEVFIPLLIISLLLLGFGYWVGEASYSIIGLTFLFILSSAILIPNNLEVPSGETVNTSFSYDINDTLTSSYEVNNTTYTNPITRFYGVWMSIIAGAGFFLVWNDSRGGEYDE